MPESLCSYFQYDEFPVFMTMFYTVTLAIVLAQMLRVVHHVWFVSRPKHNYINIAKAQAEGPSDYLTPWGCFANRGCLQVQPNAYTHTPCRPNARSHHTRVPRALLEKC